VTADLFFEDVEPGMTFLTTSRTIVADDIYKFADISGDHHPIHTDAAYAAGTEFGQRIAHGPFGIALAIGLFGTLRQFSRTGIVMLSIDNWQFRMPMFIGDELHLELTIGEKRITRSGRGITGRHFKLIRADGSIPQEGDSPMIITRRDR
jgi:acyl dehydratase